MGTPLGDLRSFVQIRERSLFFRAVSSMGLDSGSQKAACRPHACEWLTCANSGVGQCVPETCVFLFLSPSPPPSSLLHSSIPVPLSFCLCLSFKRWITRLDCILFWEDVLSTGNREHCRKSPSCAIIMLAFQEETLVATSEKNQKQNKNYGRVICGKSLK